MMYYLFHLNNTLFCLASIDGDEVGGLEITEEMYHSTGSALPYYNETTKDLREKLWHGIIDEVKFISNNEAALLAFEVGPMSRLPVLSTRRLARIFQVGSAGVSMWTHKWKRDNNSKDGRKALKAYHLKRRGEIRREEDARLP